MSLYRPKHRVETIRCSSLVETEEATYCLQWQPKREYLGLFFKGPMDIRRGTVQRFCDAMRDMPEGTTEAWFEKPRYLYEYRRYPTVNSAKWAVRYWLQRGRVHEPKRDQL